MESLNLLQPPTGALCLEHAKNVIDKRHHRCFVEGNAHRDIDPVFLQRQGLKHRSEAASVWKHNQGAIQLLCRIRGQHVAHVLRLAYGRRTRHSVNFGRRWRSDSWGMGRHRVLPHKQASFVYVVHVAGVSTIRVVLQFWPLPRQVFGRSGGQPAANTGPHRAVLLLRPPAASCCPRRHPHLEDVVQSTQRWQTPIDVRMLFGLQTIELPKTPTRRRMSPNWGLFTSAKHGPPESRQSPPGQGQIGRRSDPAVQHPAGEPGHHFEWVSSSERR